jgi:hypothetical protein
LRSAGPDAFSARRFALGVGQRPHKIKTPTGKVGAQKISTNQHTTAVKFLGAQKGASGKNAELASKRY